MKPNFFIPLIWDILGKREGVTNLISQIVWSFFFRKFLQKGVHVHTFPNILYTNVILEHKFVLLQSFSSLRVVDCEKMAFVISKMN